MSEPQLLERCRELVERCRKALEELRVHVKAACSHREKCSKLLAAATTAVGTLEELHLNCGDTDTNEAKALRQLCTCVQIAIDQGEATVKLYGHMGPLAKLTAKLGASDTNARFEEVTQELAALAEQAQRAVDTSSPHWEPSMAMGAAATAVPLLGKIDSGVDQGPTTQKDKEVPAEALQPQQLHRGRLDQAVTAMLYVPPEANASAGSKGRMWYYISKVFGGGLYVHDLSSQACVEVKDPRAHAKVTCMHYDPLTHVFWTGHKEGYVRAWSEAQLAPICEPFTAFSAASTVRALATDEKGNLWAGSDKGAVKCLRLEDIERDGAKLGVTVAVRGALKWAGPGVPDGAYSSSAPPGDSAWVDNKHLKEPAHYGPVTAIAAALGRVWTSGGSEPFACLREWTQNGDHLASTDLRSVGSANCMQLTSQVVHVRSGPEPLPPALVDHAGVMGRNVGREISMFWQLLTAHDSGLVQVWAMIGQALHPILRIGDRMAPAKAIVVCEQLGAVVTAHSDGRLLLRSLPRLEGASALSVTYTPGSISTVKLTYAEVEANKTGLALADGGVVGVITTSNNGTITLWPEAVLRKVAQEKGRALMSEHSPCELSPIHAYNSTVLQMAISSAKAALPMAGLSDPGLIAAQPDGAKSVWRPDSMVYFPFCRA